MKTILTSGTAIALSSVVETSNIDEISAVLIQVIIGIITIIKLLKQNANNQERPNTEREEKIKSTTIHPQDNICD